MSAPSTGLKDVVEIQAQKVRQPIGEFLVAAIDAHTLVDLSYSDIRRMEGTDGLREVERYLGIQRPLKPNRVKEIRRYILNNKDATFPTSIILAIDGKCAEYDEANGMLKLYPFVPEEGSEEQDIPKHKIAKVLDGQHRIAGFFEGDGSTREFSYGDPFDVNVSIFIGIDLPEQAKIFATVNLAQTKVNKSLVYDLEELARERNPFKTCHHIAVALDSNQDSPFYQRIKRLGVATPGRAYEPLTQAAFVEALVKFISDDPERDRNDILDGKRLRKLPSEKYPFRSHFEQGDKGDLVIYKIIYNFFDAVRQKWPTAWKEINRTGNLLPKSNAFKAFMRFLRAEVCSDLSDWDIELVPTVEKFISTIEHVELTDRDFTTRNFAPGSGGESTFYKVLKGQINANDLFE